MYSTEKVLQDTEAPSTNAATPNGITSRSASAPDNKGPVAYDRSGSTKAVSMDRGLEDANPSKSNPSQPVDRSLSSRSWSHYVTFSASKVHKDGEGGGEEGQGEEEAEEGEEPWQPLEGHEGKFIDLTKLYMGQKFASGAYGRLYQGVYDGADVAVKILRAPENTDMSAKLSHQFKQEVDMLARIGDHDNVVRFIGACHRDPVWCIVLEFMAGGNLRKFLQDREGLPLPMGQILAMALDIARGMQHLHTKDVIHRDLKPENLLLSSKQEVKIADFGVARLQAAPSDMTAETGTYRWMAPEMINHSPYSHKVDVYSFGVVLVELVTGQEPFPGMSAVQAAFAVVNKGARPDIPPGCPPAMNLLIQQCWHANPDRRPEFSEVVATLEKLQKSFLANPQNLHKSRETACCSLM